MNKLTMIAANASVGIVIIVKWSLWAYPLNPDPSPVFATAGPIKIDNTAWENMLAQNMWVGLGAGTDRNKEPPAEEPFT